MLLLVATLGTAVVLGECYAAATIWLAPPWLAALSVNVALGALVLVWHVKRGDTKLYSPVALWWFTPPLLLLGLCGLFAWLSRQVVAGAAETVFSGNSISVPWAWLVCVPIAEEAVFRAGIGQMLMRIAPRLWAAWFSAAIFALAHAQPTLSHFLAGQVGLAVGPFLLALACEALVATSGSIWPGILLHAVCNATVVVFQAVDARWLEWLKFLYA
jgi:membrane protease YdiL (CAAX protease family)